MKVGKGEAGYLWRFVKDEGGNFAVIAALVMVPMMVAVGGGVDYGEALRQQSIMQEAADAAALAAAPYPVAERERVANAVYFSNYPGPLANSELSITTGEGDAVVVGATGDMGTNFLRLIGMGELEIAATATAIVSQTPDQTVIETVEVTTENYKTACIMSLAPSGAQTLLVNSPAKVDGGDCEVHVKSRSNDAFLFNTSSTLNVDAICIEGTAIKRGNTTGQILERCTTVNDTIGDRLPHPGVGACNKTNWTPPVSGAITLSPGVYCGDTNFNGKPKIKLMPGLYIIKDGSWNLNDGVELSGDDVTIYFAGSRATIRMNGNMSLDLSAPRSGPYAGLLFYQQPGLQADNFIVNGRNGQHLEGLIYLPTQNVYFKSRTMAGKTDAVNVVARSFIIDGESDWRFTPYDMYTINGSKFTTTVTEQREVVIPGEPGQPYLIR